MISRQFTRVTRSLTHEEGEDALEPALYLVTEVELLHELLHLALVGL